MFEKVNLSVILFILILKEVDKMHLYDKQFIAVVPDENETRKITENKEVSQFIYKTIVSKPNEELLTEINRIITDVNISGIITRGSLAHYLFSKKVPVPIFDLKFDFISLLKSIEKCSNNGYRKICIFEIGYSNSEEKSKELSLYTRMENYELYYYKMLENSVIESIISNMAKNKTVDVIIGDIEPTRIARKYNIPVVHINIDDSSWEETINFARHSTDITMKAKSKNNFIEIITNIVTEAVIIVDSIGNIKRYNMQAEQLFFKNENYINITEIFDISIDSLLTAPANSILSNQNNNYVVNNIPVIMDKEQLYSIIINNVKYVENLEMSIRKQNKQKGLTAKAYFKDIIYKDTNTKKIVEISKKYSKSNGTIIIYGESGTGKEVFASSIHNESLRSKGPFVAINCASFNENLIESELFGYEKGSFTGALNSGKKGLFEIAHNGTLFLDEIGELPLNLQAKLLRVIQEKEIMRIGGDKIIPIDVRIISATNKNLKSMVENKLFREDLYYRLALLEIELIPLRNRPNDIIPLFTSFLTKIANQENKSVYWDDTSIFNSLLSYDWPGNIRELRNFAERVIILANKNKITKHFINEMLSQKHNSHNNISNFSTSITNNLKDLEKSYIEFLLNRFNNDKEKLCEYLEISKTTLWRKLNM